MEKEIWKDIPGYEGIYKMSNTRKIISLQRIGSNGKLYREKEMKFNNSRGYETVWLSKDKKQKLFYIDRLYFEIFNVEEK